MKTPSPFLEWFVDDDIPNCGHLYRDGIWYGSVEKDDTGWAVTVHQAGRTTHVASGKTVDAAKRRLEKHARGGGQ